MMLSSQGETTIRREDSGGRQVDSRHDHHLGAAVLVGAGAVVARHRGAHLCRREGHLARPRHQPRHRGQDAVRGPACQRARRGRRPHPRRLAAQEGPDELVAVGRQPGDPQAGQGRARQDHHGRGLRRGARRGLRRGARPRHCRPRPQARPLGQDAAAVGQPARQLSRLRELGAQQGPGRLPHYRPRPRLHGDGRPSRSQWYASPPPFYTFEPD